MITWEWLWINLNFELCFIFGAIFVSKKLEKRNYFIFRLIFALLFFFLVVLTNQILRNVLPENIIGSFLYDRAFFVIEYLLLFLTVMFCYKSNVWVSLFISNIAYCIQHISHRVFKILQYSLFPNLEWYFAAIPQTIVIIVIYFVFCYLINKVIVSKYVLTNSIENSKTQLLISTLGMFTIIIFNTLVSNNIPSVEGYPWPRIGNYIQSLVFSIVILAYQVSILSDTSSKNDYKRMQTLYEDSEKQYNNEKTIIDALNIKAHDLKHFINSTNNQSENKEIEALVNFYDANIETGYKPLDVVLTRENFKCINDKIKFICMADGKLLDFMSEVDVYTLVGNILDNAIEASCNVSKEERLITFNISKKKGFVFVRAVNTFAGKIEFENNLPRTTKNNPLYHGFGLTSIELTTKKYKGDMKIYIKENHFFLDLMFPL